MYRIGRSGSTQDAGFLTATSDSSPATMPSSHSGLVETGGISCERVGCLFRLAKMGHDPVDDVLVLDASDDFDRPTAATANLDVDIEYSLESLGPGHRDVQFRG